MSACQLLRSGGPLVIIQKMLRHPDSRIADATHGHLRPDHLRTEVERLQLPGLCAPTPAGFEPRRLAV